MSGDANPKAVTVRKESRTQGMATAASALLTRATRERSRPSFFGVVPRGGVRRRPTDLIRLVAAVLVIIVGTAVGDGPNTAADGLDDWLSGLPIWLDTVGTWLYVLGTAGASVVVVAALVITGNRRLALGLVVAGGLTIAVTATVSRGSEVWLAAATTVLLTVVPYLIRPARRLVHWIQVLAVLGALLAAISPVGAIVTAVGIGWAMSAATNLAIGTPSATPTVRSVLSDLGELDIAIDALTLADEQRWGETRFVGHTPEGAPATVIVMGRDGPDARVLSRLWRSLMYLDAGPDVGASRSAQLEHRAYMLLLAARAGVTVSEVVVSTSGGLADLALLVLLDPVGRPLSHMSADEVVDSVLDDVWASLGRLHDAGLAHGLIGPANIVLAADGSTGLLDFSLASSAAPVERLMRDRVDLLATTSALVGDERSLRAAVRALGNDGVAELLPFLQTAALSPAARRLFTSPRKQLNSLRQAGAGVTGTEVPELTELRRVTPGMVAMAAMTFLGFYLVVAQFAGVDLRAILAKAEWSWVVVVGLLSFVIPFTGSISLMGAVSRPLPFVPVLAVQFANDFTGLIGGTAASTALAIRFFQKQGLKVVEAASSGILNSLAGGIVQLVLIVIGLLISDSQFTLPSDERDGNLGPLIVIAIVVIGVAVTAALLIPKLRGAVRRHVQPHIAEARDTLRQILTTPRQAVKVFGGNLCTQMTYALILGAALRAFGVSLSLADLAVLQCISAVLGGMAPVPGGLGVTEAGLIAGMTALGVPQPVAFAATFTARTFTHYLPPIWGWAALRWLRRHDYV